MQKTVQLLFRAEHEPGEEGPGFLLVEVNEALLQEISRVYQLICTAGLEDATVCWKGQWVGSSDPPLEGCDKNWATSNDVLHISRGGEFFFMATTDDVGVQVCSLSMPIEDLLILAADAKNIIETNAKDFAAVKVVLLPVDHEGDHDMLLEEFNASVNRSPAMVDELGSGSTPPTLH